MVNAKKDFVEKWKKNGVATLGMTMTDEQLINECRDLAENGAGGTLTKRALYQAANRIETLNAMLSASQESLSEQLAFRKEQSDTIDSLTNMVNKLHEQIDELTPYTNDEIKLFQKCFNYGLISIDALTKFTKRESIEHAIGLLKSVGKHDDQ